MQKWAQEFASLLKPGSVVALYGNLGAGKTTLVQMMAPLLLQEKANIHSPTFSYLHVYEGNIPIFHFDLYRLKSLEDFVNLGWEEHLYEEGVCFIEWPEKISSLLPKNTFHLTLDIASNKRRITLTKN